MRSASTIARICAACRRGLAGLAVLAFVLTGFAGFHAVHAQAAAPDRTVAAASDDGHCPADGKPAKQAPEKSLSCCASACLPFMVLGAPAKLAPDLPSGLRTVPPRDHLIAAGAPALPFRPPRPNA